jgi:hypothetical protein
MLRDEYRPTVSKGKVLRGIFGHKSEMIIEGWRKVHNEELHTSRLSPDIIRVITTGSIRSTAHEARMGGRSERCLGS